MTKNQKDEFAATYVDFKAIGENFRAMAHYFSGKWAVLMNEAINSTLTDATKANTEELQNNISSLAKEMETQFEALVLDRAYETYHMGYVEGMNMANNGCAKVLKQLIDEGHIDDSDGGVANFIEVLTRNSAEVLDREAKGKNLNIYQAKTGDKNDKK